MRLALILLGALLLAAVTFFATNRLWKTPVQQWGAKGCAHILILNVAGIDPKMTEDTAKKFHSNMPILQVLPPCSRDSGSVRGHSWK
jgi:hypothetical protein